MTNTEETEANKTALTTAHDTYQKGLNAYAFFKVHNTASSGDLVQDTFVKTWRYLVKGGKIDLMKAFLYHVLNGLIIDEYRKRKNTSLDALLEKGFDPSENNQASLLNFIDGKRAALLIPQLPKTYQKVIRMRYVQDLSLTEISLITGQSKNTIAVQVHRGLEKLKTLHDRKSYHVYP